MNSRANLDEYQTVLVAGYQANLASLAAILSGYNF